MELFLGVALAVFLLYNILLTLWYISERKRLNTEINRLQDIISSLTQEIRQGNMAIGKIDGKISILDNVDKHVFTSTQMVSQISRSLEEVSPKITKLYESIIGNRGRSGEMILQFLLERILLPGEYESQVTMGPYRVDVLLKLDMGGAVMKIPVDSKFTYGDESDVKARIDEVAKYVPYSDTGFALMYVPSDTLFAEITQNVHLIDYAFSKGVYIVGPTSLYAFVRSAHMMKSLVDASQKHKETLKKVSSIKKDIDDILGESEKVLRHSRNMIARLESLNEKLRRIKEV
ncbi:MAG: DNA recombination protein RmuC [Dictyoglomi bacterium]|nr:DNA recombination protein RmuC [Dictyoglomota bacterium]